jgi:NTE family protein
MAFTATSCSPKYEQRFLKRDVQGKIIARMLSPAYWGKLWSTGWSRSELAAQLYDEILFNGATFADLDRCTGPLILVSATDIKLGRHGYRDETLLLLAYRHGLRVSELAALRWNQVDLKAGLLHVARLKNGIDSVHPLRGPELRALRRCKENTRAAPTCS